jgi:TolB protein
MLNSPHTSITRGFLTLLAVGITLLSFADLDACAQIPQSAAAPKAASDFAPPRRWEIVFARNLSSPGQPFGTPANIFVVNADKNSPEIKLTNDDLSVRPVWSPDGAKVAFIREGKSGGIFVMDADGTNLRRITQGPEGIGTLAWSPDGKYMAYEVRSVRNLNQTSIVLDRQIYLVNLEGDARPYLLASDGALPSWSPDGHQIAFTSIRRTGPDKWATSVSVVSVNAGSAPHMLIDNARSLSWAPDGQHILYVATASPKLELFVADPDGSNPRRISDKRYDVISAAWSPDGKHIAFSSTRLVDAGFSTAAHFEGPDSGSFQGDYSASIDPEINHMGQRSSTTPIAQKASELFVVRADGSDLVHLGPRQNVWCNQFSWSPDSSSIAGICGSDLSDPSRYRQRLSTDSILILSVTNPHSKPRAIAHGGIESIDSAPGALSH